MSQDNLDFLLQPKSIAVVGASAKPGKIGYLLLENILQGGYLGKVYPINPSASEILGLKVYSSIHSVAKEIDVALISVPAKMVSQAAEECGKKGVKGLVVITSGFSEVGENELEKGLVEIAQRHNMRILGPNVVGTLSNSNRLNASFIAPLPLPGKVSMISQSGALLAALNLASHNYRAGFEKLVSVGNMADIDFADVIEWLDQDEDTRCVSLYMEGIKDGAAFIKAGQKSSKPIIALKAGVSEHGAAAAASHTGSLAGTAEIYKAGFEKAGVVQASGLGNLFNRSLALSIQPRMQGDHLAIITNGGGVGVLSTDAAEHFGMPIQFMPQDLQDELMEVLPPFASAKNPVDLTGIAGSDWYYPTIKSALLHPWTDGLVILFTEGAGHDPVNIAKTIRQAVDESNVDDKPVTVSFIGGTQSEKAMKWLVEHGIPAYNVPEEAIDALAALNEYAKLKEALTLAGETYTKGKPELARKIIQKARSENRLALTELEAHQVFSAYDLPVIKMDLAKSEEEAVQIAKELGYPVVMKIVSPDILHKSDAGGVQVNIKDDEGVKDAYHQLIENAQAYKADAQIQGILIQEMAASGLEVILGSVNDATFGPAVMFGLGGVFVEVLEDITFKVAPLTLEEAKEMPKKIRGKSLLDGARGEAPRDTEALIELLWRYSALIHDLADEIAESDANPSILHEKGKGIQIVDARILLKEKKTSAAVE